MSRWPTIPLGSVCEIVGGGTPSRKRSEFFGGAIPWITPTDVTKRKGRYLSHGSETITDLGLQSSSARLLPARSVLLTSRATIGFTAINSVPVSTNQGFANFICGPDVWPEFLAYWLEWSREQLISLASGATFKEINKSTLKKLPAPIPPIDEQRRIVRLLDRASEIRRRADAARAKARALIPALFTDMFGDPATNPMGWETKKVRDLADRISDGPFGSNLKSEHYTNSGVRVWRLQNVGVGMLINKDKAFISDEHYRSLAKHTCLPGDVIIGTLGDPNLRAFTQPKSIPLAINKADCVQLRCNSTIASPDYVTALMNQPSMLQLCKGQITGQTRTRISMGRLRDVTVPVPPLDLQTAFAEKVRRIEALASNLDTAAAKAEALAASLSAEVFGQ